MFRILQFSYTLHIFCRAQNYLIFWSTAPPPIWRKYLLLYHTFRTVLLAESNISHTRC